MKRSAASSDNPSPSVKAHMLEAEKTSTAKAPFDNPECDIILRSADGVNFHVFKLILSLVSPVFQSMFTLPQDMTQSDISSVPIIPMTENSTTLKSLLLLCYPAATPTFKCLEDAKAVLEAARKYDMGPVLDRAKDMVFDQFLSTNSLGLYALSCTFGWQQHSQEAATRTLEMTLRDVGRPGSEFAGMRDISAYDYHKLLVYHYECGIAAQAVGESLTWLKPPYDDVCMWTHNYFAASTCDCVRKTSKLRGPDHVYITTWFEEYLVSSGKELYARPCELTLWNTASYNCAVNKALGCAYCRSKVIEGMNIFRTLYAARLKKVLANVKLKAD